METSDEPKSSKIISIQSAEVTTSKSEKGSKKTFGLFSKFKSKISSSFSSGPQDAANFVEKVKKKMVLI